MYDLNAFAVRKGNKIEVTISGNLADSCHRAIVEDIYPGGNRQYVRDPGEAQVFIREWIATTGSVCAMILIPWAVTLDIADTQHSTVGIYKTKKKS